MKKLLLLIALLPFIANAQEEHGEHAEHTSVSEHDKYNEHDNNAEHSEHGEFKNWYIGATMSQSYIPALHTEEEETTAQFIPTNGIEVMYAFNHKFYAKWINEIEFQNYTVKGHDGEHRVRDNALLTAIVLGYEVYDHLGIFAGGGYEFEKNENLWVARAGAEYSFLLPGDWVIAPALVFDYKAESHTAYTFSLSIGKRF